MESCAHKVNLRLLVTSKHAGGIELAAVSIAIKTQRSKHAFAWFSHKPDQYFAAWRVWAFRGGLVPDATIVTSLQAVWSDRIRSQGQELKLELDKRLGPTTDQQSQLTGCVE